jgi:hypothetical protein
MNRDAKPGRRLPLSLAALMAVLVVVSGCGSIHPYISEADIVGFTIGVGDPPSDTTGLYLSSQFSGQFPEDGVLVMTWEGESTDRTEYDLDSPELLPAIWELLGREQPRSLEASEQGLWLPE